MNLSNYDKFTTLNTDNSINNKSKISIPYVYFFLYIIIASALCIIYHIKIIEPFNWNAPNSINAVMGFETAKPYQFRLLIPFLFKLIEPIYLFYGKYFFTLYNIIIIFLIQYVFYKLLAELFESSRYLYLYSLVIIYPIIWNYIILNQSFQYYDFTAILLFTAGLYFIVKENLLWFYVIFILGIINKETAGYLIFAYGLFNYKRLFTRKIITNLFLLGIIFISFKIFLGYIFINNPGDNFEIGYYENLNILSNLFSNKIYFKNIFLNYGGLYIFAVLLFITGKFLNFKNKKALFMNLTIIPYYILGIFITYITEVRVYTEIIPMIAILFLIYLSNYKIFKLNQILMNDK
jgi:hypothetical protein